MLVYDVSAKALPRWVAEQFARLGAKAEPDACSTLIELVGDDAEELANEIEKLAIWAAVRRSEREHVLELVAGRAETSIFALTDAWGRRDLATALGASEELLAALTVRGATSSSGSPGCSRTMSPASGAASRSPEEGVRAREAAVSR